MSSEGDSSNSETQDLLARITVLQSEKWELETRVNHLEQSNAAYAEGLLQKSALIEHYFRITKAATPLKLVQRMTGSTEMERLREINNKMQRCLEEALMKNISLQKNLDDALKELEEVQAQNKLLSPAQLECASDP